MLTVDLRAEHAGSELPFHSRFIYRVPKDLETPWFNNNIVEHLIFQTFKSEVLADLIKVSLDLAVHCIFNIEVLC